MTERSFNGWIKQDQYPNQTFTAPGGKSVYCNSRESGDDCVRIVFEYITRRWHNEIEPVAPSHPSNWHKPNERRGYKPDGTWDAIGIHCWRQPGTKVGTGDKSNHRSATALDINGHLHPYEASLPPSRRGSNYNDGFTTAQRKKLREIASSVKSRSGKVLIRLGIDFGVGLRDGMHVEIAPGVTRKEVQEAADLLRAALGVIDLVKAGEMLIDLGYTANRDGILNFQRDNAGAPHQLVADGVCGPKTFAALEADIMTMQKVLENQAKILAAQDGVADKVWGRRWTRPGSGSDNTIYASTFLRHTPTRDEIAQILLALAELNGHEVDLPALAELLAPRIADAVAEAVADLPDTDADAIAQKTVALMSSNLAA